MLGHMFTPLQRAFQAIGPRRRPRAPRYEGRGGISTRGRRRPMAELQDPRWPESSRHISHSFNVHRVLRGSVTRVTPL